MANKKLYSYDEVSTSGLTDKVPTLQSAANKVTTLQKIYNLFKTSFDTVYTTTAAVATQITTALGPYATTDYVDDLVQQATESTMGTARVVTLAELQDDTSTNDTDFIPPVKFWDVLKNTFMGLTEFSAGVAVATIANLPGGSGVIVAGEALNVMLSKLQVQLNTAVNLPGGLTPALTALKVGASTDLPIDISETDSRFNVNVELTEGNYIYLYNATGQRVRISVDAANAIIVTPV